MLVILFLSLFFIIDLALLLFTIKIISKWLIRTILGQIIEKQKVKPTYNIIIFIVVLALLVISIVQRGYINIMDLIGILFCLCLLIIGINDRISYIEIRQFGIVTSYNVLDWNFIENIEFGEIKLKSEGLHKYIKFNAKWHGIKYSVKVRNLDDSMISHITSKCKVKPKEQA